MSTREQRSMTSAISLRHLREDEVTQMYELITAEEWHLTLPKFKSIVRMKPEAFFVLVDQEGNIVATFSLMPTFPGEVLLGNLVVRKSHRGKGIGKKILTYYVHQAVKFRTLVLVAVPQALGFYKKVKMCLVEPRQDHVVAHTKVDPEAIERKFDLLKTDLINIQICALDKSSLDELISYDKHVHGGYDTSVNLTAAVENYDVVIAVDTSTNMMVGYSASFITNKEVAFDGIFADSEAIALALYRESLRAHSDVPNVRLDMFQSQQFLAQFGRTIDTYKYLKFAFGCPKPVSAEKCFCVSDCDYTV